MIEAAFWLAVACAVAGTFAGNRTAWALLASVGMCLGLEHFAVPFNFFLWLLIDLAVILIIIRPEMTVADVVVLALFIPAWVSYLLPPEPRFGVSMAVVIAQLALVFPAETVRRGIVRLFERGRARNFDEMAVA
jgi:hypothetical protein